MLHHQWTSTLKCMEDLTHRHLRSVTQAYRYASICAHITKHLRDLLSLYDSALGTKQAYHTILTTHIEDQMHTTCGNNTSLKQLRLIMPQSRDSPLYTKSATIIGLYERLTEYLHRLQALTDTCCSYTPHILYHALGWARHQRLETSAQQSMHQLYTTKMRHIHQQLYLHRKRPREVWGPTLWEIPLLPLPKRHKAH